MKESCGICPNVSHIECITGFHLGSRLVEETHDGFPLQFYPTFRGVPTFSFTLWADKPPRNRGACLLHPERSVLWQRYLLSRTKPPEAHPPFHVCTIEEGSYSLSLCLHWRPLLRRVPRHTLASPQASLVTITRTAEPRKKVPRLPDPGLRGSRFGLHPQRSG